VDKSIRASHFWFRVVYSFVHRPLPKRILIFAFLVEGDYAMNIYLGFISDKKVYLV
jgi:hypothetical protein